MAEWLRAQMHHLFDNAIVKEKGSVFKPYRRVINIKKFFFFWREAISRSIDLSICFSGGKPLAYIVLTSPYVFSILSII